VIYASDLVVKGTRLPLDGVPWQGKATQCACCGKPVNPGDIAVIDKHRFGPNFTDGPALAAKGSGAVCGSCSAVMNAPPLAALQRHLITSEGAFSLGTDSARTWLLLTPPEPPWVAVITDSKQSHMIWRTPVTVDNNLMTIRYGGRLLRIRRSILMEAIQDCQTLMDDLRAFKAAQVKGAKLAEDSKHPFVDLKREMDQPMFGVVRADVMVMAKAKRELATIARLQRLAQLTPGELWGLATLIKKTPVTPERPQPVRFD